MTVDDRAIKRIKAAWRREYGSVRGVESSYLGNYVWRFSRGAEQMLVYVNNPARYRYQKMVLPDV